MFWSNLRLSRRNRWLAALVALLVAVPTAGAASAQGPHVDGPIEAKIWAEEYWHGYDAERVSGYRPLVLHPWTDGAVNQKWNFRIVIQGGEPDEQEVLLSRSVNFYGSDYSFLVRNDADGRLPLMPCDGQWSVQGWAQLADSAPDGEWIKLFGEDVTIVAPLYGCADEPPTTQDVTVTADVGQTVEFMVPAQQLADHYRFEFHVPSPSNGDIEQIEGGRFNFTASKRGAETVTAAIPFCEKLDGLCWPYFIPIPPSHEFVLYPQITFEVWDVKEPIGPNFDPTTGILTVPYDEGVYYRINGGDPYEPGMEYQVCGTVVVEADAETVNYVRLAGTTSWTYEYDCDADQTETVVERVAGSDRYATAAAVAMKFGTADRVFIASGQAHADAMVSSAAAEPVLLTRSDSLPAVSRAALASLKPKQIVIVGGESRVSAKVEADLRQYGQVIRVAGSDRYATAAKFLQERGQVDVVYLANGLDSHFPDALSAGARSGSQGAAVLLTRQNALPGATVAALRDAQPGRVVLVGGEDVVSRQVAKQLEGMGFSPERLSGPDRYQTALAVSRTFDSANIVFVASGAEFPDALSGGALAGYRGGPMLLTRPDRLPNGVIDEIRRLGAKEVYLLGGTGAVSESVERQLRDLLND